MVREYDDRHASRFDLYDSDEKQLVYLYLSEYLENKGRSDR